MATTPLVLYNALIRTHHIISRRKVAILKASAHKKSCYVVIRSGGCPGIMYCQGSEVTVKQWVSEVQVGLCVTDARPDMLTGSKNLRYKDFSLASHPAPITSQDRVAPITSQGRFIEVESVKDFARLMEGLGLLSWWRKAMRYDM